MEQLQQTLISVAILVIPVLGVYLVALIKNKTKEITSRTNNNTLNQYLYLASDTIQTAVTSISQTYVDALKKSGQWNAEAQKEAFEKAKTLVLLQLSDATKKAISQAYGDLESYVDNSIEKYVNQTKSYYNVPAPQINIPIEEEKDEMPQL